PVGEAKLRQPTSGDQTMQATVGCEFSCRSALLELGRFLELHTEPALLLGPDGEQAPLPKEVYSVLVRVVDALREGKVIWDTVLGLVVGPSRAATAVRFRDGCSSALTVRAPNFVAIMPTIRDRAGSDRGGKSLGGHDTLRSLLRAMAQAMYSMASVR